MLEVFYEIDTKIVTAWRGEGRQNIRPIREDEAKAILDINPPTYPPATVRDFLYDGNSLILNPDYIEPPPPRDLGAEVDKLTAEVEELKKGAK